MTYVPSLRIMGTALLGSCFALVALSIASDKDFIAWMPESFVPLVFGVTMLCIMVDAARAKDIVVLQSQFIESVNNMFTPFAVTSVVVSIMADSLTPLYQAGILFDLIVPMGALTSVVVFVAMVIGVAVQKFLG